MARTTTCCLRSGLLVGKRPPLGKCGLLFTYPANSVVPDLPFVFPVLSVYIKSVFDIFFTGFKNRAKSLFPIGLLALSLCALKNNNKVREILK